MKCSYYTGNIKSTIPRGETTIERLLYGIKKPKPHILAQLNRLKEAKTLEQKTEIKHNLFYFTPAVVIAKGMPRKYDNIQEFSGFLPLDFDIKTEPEEYSKDFKNALFDTYPYIYAAWLSSSGRGVRALVKITTPTCIAEYTLKFNAIELEMKAYKGFDSATKNAVLPLFISHDPEILIRPQEETETYTDSYLPPKPKPKPYIPAVKVPEKKRFFSIISSAFNKIFDNGHPQLRAACAVAGGFVGAGYIGELEALSHIESLIRSNPYLSQFGEAKIQTYLKTAQDMVRKGAQSPLYA